MSLELPYANASKVRFSTLFLKLDQVTFEHCLHCKIKIQVIHSN